MANDYRILDERDIKNFQSGNKLNVMEIGNKVTYEHIGEPPDRLPSKEQALEYGKSFDITVPSVYDSTGHVKSETTYFFKMPDKVDISNGLTVNNFSASTPIRVNKNGNNITYSHDLSTVNEPTKKLSPNSENVVTFTALSAVDSYGHANQKTTYSFEIPDTSNYPTKNDFAAVAPLSVVKGENNNTITYSHGGSSPSKNAQDKSTNLTFGNPFEITIPSAYNNTGHVTETQKYIFTMPAAPSGNTTGIITKNDFTAGALLTVAKGENDNTVNYSHDTVTTSTETPTTVDLAYGDTFSFNALSTADDYGHATKKTTYKFKIPGLPSIRDCIGPEGANSFYYYSKDIGYQINELNTDANLSLTAICFITFYPSTGYEDPEGGKIIAPGPFTIPIATYARTMDMVSYTFQALKIRETKIDNQNLVSSIQTTTYTVKTQLQGDTSNSDAWFYLQFPKSLFSKITIMGF